VDVTTPVAFSGMTPTSVGHQINVTVPSTLTPGNQPLIVSVNGVISETSSLAVQ